MIVTDQKRRRRFLRLVILAPILLVLAVAITLGLIAHKARQQRQAVAALDEMGCKVSFARHDTWTLLERVRKMLGEDEPRNVVMLNCQHSNLTDEGMIHLEALPQLEELNLTDTQVTDEGLTHIRDLVQLTRLYLGRSRKGPVERAGRRTYKPYLKIEVVHVTDTGMAQLRQLAKLEVLSLRGSQVTDVGLLHFDEFPKLESLFIDETQVADAGLFRLAGLTQLRELDLAMTRVTDSGLDHLQGLTQLAHLNLAGTQITDAGLASLQELTRLTDLQLQYTAITDAGVESLRRRANLAFLGLAATQVSTSGLYELEKALPTCIITGNVTRR
jgi:Leucine-rich repeat (LRR) protein